MCHERCDESRYRTFVSLVQSCLLLAVISTAGCGEKRPDPKDTVKGMFTAIQQSDSVYLKTNVDLSQAARGVEQDLRAGDTAGTAADQVGLLLRALTGDGVLRKRWLENQIVLGESQVQGDTALVEVSFLDKVTRVQYYNRMRLVYRGGRWCVTDFRTM